MAISVGSQSVKSIFVGSTPVQAVYVGSTKIWPSVRYKWQHTEGALVMFCYTRMRNPVVGDMTQDEEGRAYFEIKEVSGNPVSTIRIGDVLYTYNYVGEESV